MSYRVKEMFCTLQGEGINTGRAAVFCRFTGCNLWTGREEHRGGAICRFCDTDFVGTDGPGGGVFATAETLADAVAASWVEGTGTMATAPPRGVRPLVVCTGGEPLLQFDAPAAAAMSAAGFEVAVETNGTVEVPEGIDWVCMSPKAGSEVLVREGDELKLVFPQAGAEPERFEGPEWDFDHLVLQPMDGPDLGANTSAAAAYCRAHPRWRLGIQTHKAVGIP